MSGKLAELVDYLLAERFDCLWVKSKQSLLIAYKRSELNFLVRAEWVYCADQVEDASATTAAAMGKEVTLVSFPICVKFFADHRPSFQVWSDSLTVFLSTETSAAPNYLPWPWHECYTETMELTLKSGIQLGSVIEIEYAISDDG